MMPAGFELGTGAASCIPLRVRCPVRKQRSPIFCWPYTDPQTVEREIHALCDVLIALEGRLGP